MLAIHRPTPSRNRHVLTLLSAIWPGLGQAAAGARRAALVLALPPIVLVALGVAAIASPDRLTRLAQLFDPAVIAAALGVEIALLAWRLGAVADAFRRGEGAIGGRASVLTAIGLAFVIVPSVYAAYLTEVTREAALQVYSAVEPQGWRPDGTPPPDPDFDVYESPAPSAPDLGRFTVLFIGADAAPGRNTFATDTMIVASLDPVSNSVSMISMPRDTVDLPLPDGRVFHGKINSLVSYVRNHPKLFPGAPSGETVLADTLGAAYGIRVDGWVEVNMPGFIGTVDSLGGIDVTVHDAFCDPTYHEFGYTRGFSIGVGRYHFNGEQALAYARVRKADGESDFTRAARQQEVIVAIRDRVVSGGFVNDPAGFISSFGQLLRTNLSPAQFSPYVDVASRVTRDRIFRSVITYPLVKFLPGDPRGWVIAPVMDRIRALAAAAFPPAGTLPTPSGGTPSTPGATPSTEGGSSLVVMPPDDGKPRSSGPGSCLAAPTATPQPSPTPAATVPPSSEPSPAPSDSPPPTPGASPTDKPGGKPTPDPSPTAGP